MATTRETTRADGKGIPTLATELWQLVLTYLRQETVVPLKGLARFVGWGLAGSFVLGIGLVMLVLALLRALQTETDATFDGDWSWAPYLITLVACGVVAGMSARAIGSHKRRARRKGTMA